LDRATLFDLGPAGTAFRFLTAAACLRNGRRIITGSERMLQRPIGPLVDALRILGAQIEYLGEEGYPPIAVEGTTDLPRQSVDIDPSISSQFVSALLLIAPFTSQGIQIRFTDLPTSRSYLAMTCSVLKQCGVKIDEDPLSIRVYPGFQSTSLNIEADWSAASYFYSAVALHPNLRIVLRGLTAKSLQGDAETARIYEVFQVTTTQTEAGVIIAKDLSRPMPRTVSFDLNNQPDLAQTLMVTCAGLGIDAEWTGLETLYIKETDRIAAMTAELKAFGIELIEMAKGKIRQKGKAVKPPENHLIKTYHDHRMAMAFAPLTLFFPDLTFENPDVVKKSFPSFWREWLKITATSIQ
ncbi:MAG TPA: 3-phosphoshikimate 1-carboxyvinyltransferase, partial [Luteibaculaceae bacterium]|nr:3-phosphoshikimate 1-carboxyvinyltransferase [Luteibaculaceae bacterium]